MTGDNKLLYTYTGIVEGADQVISNSEEIEVVIAASESESEERLAFVCKCIKELENIIRRNNSHLRIRVTTETNPERVTMENCKLFLIIIDVTVERWMRKLYDMAYEYHSKCGLPVIQAYINKKSLKKIKSNERLNQFRESFESHFNAPVYFDNTYRIQNGIWKALLEIISNEVQPDISFFDKSFLVIEREMDELDQLKKEYRESSDAVKEKIDNITARIEEQKSRIEQLKQGAVQNALLVLDKLHTINDLNDRESRAVDCISQHKDYEKANKILRDPDWEKEIYNNIRIMDGAKKACRQYISGQKLLISNLKATGIGNKEKEEIFSIYEKIVVLAEEYGIELSVLFDYAQFLYDQKELLKGIEVAERLVLYNKLNGFMDDTNTGALNNLLGKLHYDNSDYSKARTYYENALNIYGKDPIENEDMMYALYSEIATLYWKQNRHEDSIKELDKILIRLEELEKTKGGKFSYILAQSYNRLATLANRMWLLDEAEFYHLKAADLWAKLASESSKDDDLWIKLSATYNNLGLVYRRMGKYSEGEQIYKKAYDIRYQGYKDGKENYKKPFAMLCSNYAYLLAEDGQIDQAEKYVNEALTIKRKLKSHNPGAYLPTYAYSLNDYGVILLNDKVQGREKEIEAIFLEVLSIRQELSAEDYNTYAPQLAESCFCYARFLSKMDKKSAAEYYGKAFDIQEKFKNENPGCYEHELADTCYHWALLLRDEDIAKAEDLFATAEQYGSNLMEKIPKYYRQDYLRILKDYLELLSASDGTEDKAKTVRDKIGRLTKD